MHTSFDEIVAPAVARVTQGTAAEHWFSSHQCIFPSLTFARDIFQQVDIFCTAFNLPDEVASPQHGATMPQNYFFRENFFTTEKPHVNIYCVLTEFFQKCQSGLYRLSMAHFTSYSLHSPSIQVLLHLTLLRNYSTLITIRCDIASKQKTLYTRTSLVFWFLFFVFERRTF